MRLSATFLGVSLRFSMQLCCGSPLVCYQIHQSTTGSDSLPFCISIPYAEIWFDTHFRDFPYNRAASDILTHPPSVFIVRSSCDYLRVYCTCAQCNRMRLPVSRCRLRAEPIPAISLTATATTSRRDSHRAPNLTVDLGVRKVIDALWLEGENLKDYDLQASNNNITYTDIHTGETVTDGNATVSSYSKTQPPIATGGYHSHGVVHPIPTTRFMRSTSHRSCST